jgi:phosphatidylglycerophosphate synthase
MRHYVMQTILSASFQGAAVSSPPLGRSGDRPSLGSSERHRLLDFILPITAATCYRLPPTVMQEPPSKTIDRRPIATRNRKWAQDATAWLASRNVSPNAISVAGMCACIVAGIALGMTSIADYRILWLIAALGAQLRLTANMLDGMVAIASSRTSKTGELYNEVPDRISDAAVFIGAGFAWGGNVALGYIATILAIFTAYVRAAGKIAGAPNEFCGPMAKQHRMLVITLICVYAAITPRSWQIITLNKSQIGVMTLGLIVIVLGCVITVVRRVARIAHALGA